MSPPSTNHKLAQGSRERFVPVLMNEPFEHAHHGGREVIEAGNDMFPVKTKI
jgi:hypothetical protein